MANTEPKTSSSTTPARMTPEPRAPEGLAVGRLGDLAGHCHLQVGPVGLLRGWTNCLATAVEMFWPRRSKVTVANAVLLSALIWARPPGA